MAANKPFRFGPVALTNVFTTNILNPGTTTGGVGPASQNLYFLIKHVRIVETAGTGANVRFYIGATGANAAGTQALFPIDFPVAAKGFIEVYPVNLRLDVADFLVGGASAAATLTFECEGEIGVA